MAAAEKRMLADTGGHWRPLDWLQVAADEKRMLVANGGHSIGRKWVQVAADEKRSGCKWLQVAASGCQAWVKLYFSPFILSWAENIGNFPLPAHGKFITFSVGGVLAM